MTDAKAQMEQLYGDTPIPENVEIGEDCLLEFERYSFQQFRSEAQPGLTLGNRVRVHLWTAFGSGPKGVIEIGDDTVLVGAQFMCERRISVGRRVVISYNVTIADADFHPHDPHLRRKDAVANSPTGDRSQRPPIPADPVVIEDDVTVGIGAIILKGVNIGKGAEVGPGAVVTRNVPPGARAFGNPARIQDHKGQ